MIRRIYLFITKFLYYGYIGTKCYDFDASYIHNLIYAHIKRVNKFMKSNETHLMWNDNPDNKGMRLLAEFTELSKRMSKNEMNSNFYHSELVAEYPNMSIRDRLFNSDPKYKKKVSIAIKKDRKVVDGLVKRYYYLLETKVEGFWD